MSTEELFTIITSARLWYKGFCTQEYAKKIKDRHKKSKVNINLYTKLFNHFGYVKKPDEWVKERKSCFPEFTGKAYIVPRGVEYYDGEFHLSKKGEKK